MSNSSEVLKTLQKIMIEIETNLYDELSLNLLTDKQLQNNIVDLFCNQQKSFTLSIKQTHYIFSLLDALIANFLLIASNIKNTDNLQNINLK
jgi:hypothetical protein